MEAAQCRMSTSKILSHLRLSKPRIRQERGDLRKKSPHPTSNLKNSSPKVDIKSRKMINKSLKKKEWLKLTRESPKIEVKRKEETSVTQ